MIKIGARVQGLPYMRQVNQSFEYEGLLFVESQYLPQTLQQWLIDFNETTKSSRKTRRRLFFQICCCLRDLEERYMILGGLTTQEIYIKMEGTTPHICICPFSTTIKDLIGSPPESDSNMQRESMYNIGVLLLRIASCGASEIPIPHSEGDINNILKGLKVYEDDRGVVEVLQGLLHHDPSERMTSIELFQSGYMLRIERESKTDLKKKVPVEYIDDIFGE